MNILKKAERWHNGDFAVPGSENSTQVVDGQAENRGTEVAPQTVPADLSLDCESNLKSDVQNPVLNSEISSAIEDLFSSSPVSQFSPPVLIPDAEARADQPNNVPPPPDPPLVLTPPIACPTCGHGLRWLAAGPNDGHNDYCSGCDPAPLPALIVAKMVLAWWPWDPRWEFY